jgi:hypothetical protein
MNRDNHYEAAFEEYLRSKQVPYVAVDEARRSLLGDGQSIKNLDFIVSAPGSVAWLVDVKGRRFPSAEDQYWKNWSTRDDLTSLAQWESLFGPTFRGLFVFAYNIVGDRAPLSVQQLFEHKGSLYGFVGIALCDYAGLAHTISPAWDTVALSQSDFRRLARPVEEFLFGQASRSDAVDAV